MKDIFVPSSPNLIFPQRLDRYLRRHGHILQSVLEKACRQGKIRVNGQKTQPNYRIQEGDHILLDIELEAQPDLSFSNDRSEIDALILFEDDDFCVLNKPAGLAVQGGSGIEVHVDGLLNSVGRYYLVHRLDKDTSGILLVAKTPAMSHYFAQLFQNRSIQKVYHALVHGIPSVQIIEEPLLKEKEQVVVTLEGKPSTTHCKILQTYDNHTSLVELVPLTGRMHQLRVHMAHHKTPILGDHKYGFPDGRGRLHLHAYSLSFKLPDGQDRHFCVDAGFNPNLIPKETP